MTPSELAAIRERAESAGRNELRYSGDYYADDVPALLAEVELIREALEAHEEAEPLRHHGPMDACDFDTQGGQRDCPRCVAANLYNACAALRAGRGK